MSGSSVYKRRQCMTHSAAVRTSNLARARYLLRSGSKHAASPGSSTARDL